jgi:hypothetical protein
MRWQLLGDWPVQGGARLLPAGSILGDGGIPPPTTPLPINAMALDTDGALALAMAYNERDTINGWHQLIFASGIDRAAVFAQARLNRQWPPNGVPPSRAAISEAVVKTEKGSKDDDLLLRAATAKFNDLTDAGFDRLASMIRMEDYDPSRDQTGWYYNNLLPPVLTGFGINNNGFDTRYVLNLRLEEIAEQLIK